MVTALNDNYQFCVVPIFKVKLKFDSGRAASENVAQDIFLRDDVVARERGDPFRSCTSC